MKRDVAFNQRVDDLFKKFDDEFIQARKNISAKLFPLYEKLNGDMNAISSMQAELLALRQVITEQMSFFINKLLMLNKKIRVAESERLQEYIPMKKDGWSAKDIQIKIQDDLKELIASKEIFEIHVDYLKECRKNCDQIGYAIKNRNGIAVYL